MQNDGADNETDADVYAREVSHRAANTLQTAIAALHLGLRGDQRLMRRAYDQLTAASELHLMLASGERVPVNIASRVTEVCMAVGRSLGAEGDIDLVLDAKPLMVCPEDARRISMLVSELVGNSIRHAFPTGRGAILVSLNSRGGQTIITVEDDGICGGWSRPGGQGAGIVDSLTRSLHGEVHRQQTAAGSSRIMVRLPTLRTTTVPVAADS